MECNNAPAIRTLLVVLGAGLACLPVLAQEDKAIDYATDIAPIFERYCVACHACFDAPCQLDLSHPAGVARGASKSSVYDGTRLEAAEPSRLLIDVESIGEWRSRDFFTVLGDGDEPAVLLRMLDATAQRTWQVGEPVPAALDLGIGRQHICPDGREIDSTLQANPHLSMPFALPAIPRSDYESIVAWLQQGAPLSSAEAQLLSEEVGLVAQWERWLNSSEPRRKLVSRWLFEHWAIARLHFDDIDNGNFFRLVRSTTPPGEPVREISSRFPNGDPGGGFYYRFRIQSGARVYKTHIRFPLNAALLKRIDKLFFGEDWQLDELPGYTEDDRANPFTTFAGIPPEARYRFMLEHAGYFVRTFIRGPVCRGQLATDVIRDHFWVMFQAPANDPYIVDADYRRQVDPLLALPGIDDDLLDGAGQWLASTGDRNRYSSLRQQRMLELAPHGAAVADIWDGDGNNQNALLTVFRHHDSAAVMRGWWGQLPLTVWWMDYPLLERSYYNLVVNFDVFGNVSHQAQTRLYFDLIRNGAEQNFLRLLPPNARQAELDAWYAGSGQIKLWLSYQEIDADTPSAVRYRESEPKPQLLRRLLLQSAAINAGRDVINRHADRSTSEIPALLSGLTESRAEAMPAILQLPDSALIWMPDAGQGGELYTMVRNRRHTNVAFVLGESLRYEQDKDSLSIVPGIATAYPNLILMVPEVELADFVAALRSADNGEDAAFVERVVAKWAVRRSETRFWPIFHAIHDWQWREDPLEAALLDLNRYIDYHPGSGLNR